VIELEHEVTIARPPADVYAYLADPRNLTEWQSNVKEVRPESESRWVEVRQIMGRTVEQNAELAEADPGRKLTIQNTSGKVRFRIEHTLEPADGGTRVRVFLQGDGVPRLAAPVAKRQASQAAERDLAQLKTLLESRA
jgi:carbon monoxide dehydrogenase subunit G